jgi:prepilin-type N-terminal cleavage/methylation domain-containing protein
MSRVRPQDGFTLVEVILALALLGVVMISVSGLFVLGTRQLKSGRTQSTALSVSRDILEEMHGWNFDRVFSAFGNDGTATSYTIDTRTNGFASKWQPVLDESFEQGAFAEIVLQSVDGTVNPPNLDETDCIRIEVRVSWTEGERQRDVALATIRM